MNSQLFKVNGYDLLKGFIVSIISAVLTLLLTQLQSGSIDWKAVSTVALISAISYILKQLGTDQEGNALGIPKK